MAHAPITIPAENAALVEQACRLQADAYRREARRRSSAGSSLSRYRENLRGWAATLDAEAERINLLRGS